MVLIEQRFRLMRISTYASPAARPPGAMPCARLWRSTNPSQRQPCQGRLRLVLSFYGPPHKRVHGY